jgi:hypothetical protein
MVINGDRVDIKGYVDNTKSTSSISSIKIILRQHFAKVSSNGRLRHDLEQEFVLHDFQKTIEPGQKEEMTVAVNIPKQIIQHSAVGHVIERYFTLGLIC